MEVSTKIVPGNSGGPMINENVEVIGVATYMKLGEDKPDWVKKDTRYSKKRRFAIRPSRIDDWRSVEREEYARQLRVLEGKLNKFDQAYWTFIMLSEGTGYVSTIPKNWSTSVYDIIRNHNRRQRRPDSTVSKTYDSDGYLVDYERESHADKKAASKRANLRALERFLDEEFDDFYRLRNSRLDIGYLISNEIQSLDVLENWVKSLRKDIAKEIQLSKSGG